MIGFFGRLFGRNEPLLAEASSRDVAAIAKLHAASFRRGWSQQEVDGLLVDRRVIAHRAIIAGRLIGFILSRLAEDEAEILSVAVAARQQGRGLGGKLLNLHLRRLAGFGARAVFLEVDENNAAALKLYDRAGFREVSRRPAYYRNNGDKSADALVLRRDLA
jgi:ribosomal-protein-alanine N-acetyltransferase